VERETRGTGRRMVHDWHACCCTLLAWALAQDARDPQEALSSMLAEVLLQQVASPTLPLHTYLSPASACSVSSLCSCSFSLLHILSLPHTCARY
jgi:hypothetical protein